VTFPHGGRDSDEIDAMTTDRYLDALLSAHASGAVGTPASSAVDHVARAAADRLSRDLPRFHPSFRFEEGLWLRLSDVARGLQLGAAAGSDGRPVPVPGRGNAASMDLDAVALAALVDGPDPDAAPPNAVRPLLVGGALTSAALSIAGAAYVAWRLSHPGAAPMARAVRAVTRARLA
jgi:hypothetical protein